MIEDRPGTPVHIKPLELRFGEAVEVFGRQGTH